MPVSQRLLCRPTSISIGAMSPEALGLAMRALSGTGPASAAYPSANLAIAYPIRIAQTTTIACGWVPNGATASGNWDVGIYDASGAKIASTGTQAQTGTATAQSAALAAVLAPGKYYVALAADATTLTFYSTTVVATVASGLGIVQMATAFVLPSTLTIAAMAQTVLPHFGISQKASV